MAASRPKEAALNFKTVIQADIPQGRNGKHKLIVSRILSDLDQLKDGAALRIPYAELGDTKEKIRSALNRATRKAGMHVATSTDGVYLYIWNSRSSAR
jgi:hypothetical protein